MYCDLFVREDGQLECKKCGRPYRPPYVVGVKYFFRECTASRGLGDTVAKMTKAVGINPCKGCEERREILNSWFPYGSD